MAMLCRKFLLFYFALCVAVGIANGVFAGGLYSCKNKDGKVSYTSVPKGECRVIYTDNTTAKEKSPQPSAKQQSSKKFSNTSVKKQAKRDIKRSNILLYELRRETKEREEIKQDIQEAANDHTLTIQKDRYEQNGLNIVAIKKQLARLGYEIKSSEK